MQKLKASGKEGKKTIILIEKLIYESIYSLLRSQIFIDMLARKYNRVGELVCLEIENLVLCFGILKGGKILHCTNFF